MATYRLELFKKDSTTADLQITSTSVTQNYQIAQVEYEKKLFAPCYAEVTITVAVPESEKNNTLPDIAEFTGAESAKLYVCASSEKLVGEDYIVYQVKPRAENTIKTIVLTLYSRDKLLTLDKFCHVYLNQRLGADIIDGMLKSGGQLASCGVKYAVGTARLQLTDIEIVVKDKSNPPKDVPKKVELIQPYRVQYNEDFYSFISRIASVCGEFLFFEEGKLQLGINTSLKKEDIVKVDSAIIKVEKSSYKSSGLTIRSYYKDYRYKEDTEKIEEKDFTGDEDAAFDEYFDVYDKTDLPDSVKRETATPKPYFKFFQDALCSKLGVAIGAPNTFTVTSIIASIINNVGQEVGVNTANQKYINKQFKKNVFEDKLKQSPKYNSEQQEKGDKLSQFSDLDSCGKIMHRFFSEVRKREQQADLEKLTLQVNTASVYVKLGSLVEYNNTEYVVTRVHGKYNPDITEIDIVPKISVTISAYSSDNNEYKDTTVDLYVPPYNKCPELPAAQPQVAIVADVDDPRYMGRVRIRYPWQNKDDVPSPWIRILSPLASKKKNVHFEPAVNDEVMVGYIGGNIDRPYVAGSLFNKDTPIHGSLYLANSSTIKIGSQKLDFKGGTYDEWINNFFPFWDTIIQFLPGVSDKMSDFGDDKPVLDNLKGNITLTDAYGFWTIKGDTAARSVTIDSLWGKVSINAFTGISIESAGDIKIKGKNIDILASNNVNIQSGLAIKEEKDAAKFKEMGTLAELAGAAIVGPLTDIVLGKFDLSLLRTIRDLWAPPKEGTLKVKSYRNLLLEAGDGAAFYHPVSTIHNFLPNDAVKTIKEAETDLQKLLKDLMYIRERSLAYLTEVNQVGNDLYDKKKALFSKIGVYNEYLKSCNVQPILEDNVISIITEFKKKNLEDLEFYKQMTIQKDAHEEQNVKNKIDDILTAVKAFGSYKDNQADKYIEDFFPKCDKFTDQEYKEYNTILQTKCLDRMKSFVKKETQRWYDFGILRKGVTELQRYLYKKRATALVIEEADIKDVKKWEKAVMKAMAPVAPSIVDVEGNWSAFKKELKSMTGVSEYTWNPTVSGRIMMSQDPGMSQTLNDKGELITTNIPLDDEDLKLSIIRILMGNDHWNMDMK